MKIWFFCLLWIVSLPLFAAPLHVMIDPGHGGKDSGASAGRLHEADVALKVGLLLRERLAADPRFVVSMTRSSDRSLTLEERVHLAEKAKAQVLLSIHANANQDPRARGVEFYFQNHLPPDEETLFLADSENQRTKSSDADFAENEPTKKNDVISIIEDLQRHHRMLSSHVLSRSLLAAWNADKNQPVNIHQAPFFVVSKANIPSVLVEVGYITNPHEAERLGNAAYQAEIAKKIYQGLVLFHDSQEQSSHIPINEKD